MQTFKDTTGETFSFDEDVIINVVSGVYSFSDKQGNPLSVPTTLQPYTIPAPTPEQLIAVAWSAYQGEAYDLMKSSDTTLLRCVEAGIAVPSGWVTFRANLRAIIGSAVGDPTIALPSRPPYPSGT